MRDVTPDSAASVVIPSNVSPGPSPYIGLKWSKPHAPSKPSCSANCTRRTSSSHGRRCCATSMPMRIQGTYPSLYRSVQYYRGVDFSLTAAERDLADLARDFAQKEIASRAPIAWE